MRRLSTPVVAAAAVSLVLADSAGAQPRPYGQAWGPQAQSPQRGRQGRGPHQDAQRSRQPVQGAQSGGRYYYNGRWVDAGEWRRHNAERDRWARNYERRRGRNDSSSLVAGIIGFALGAAIVGSQQQAERARTADADWDAYCAKRYRSYDRASRTCMGYDGVRHYCR